MLHCVHTAHTVTALIQDSHSPTCRKSLRMLGHGTVSGAYFQLQSLSLGVRAWSCEPVPCGSTQCTPSAIRSPYPPHPLREPRPRQNNSRCCFCQIQCFYRCSRKGLGRGGEDLVGVSVLWLCAVLVRWKQRTEQHCNSWNVHRFQACCQKSTPKLWVIQGYCLGE